MREHFEKINFLKTLITHLHQYGASAGRLESAVSDVSERLGVEAEILASATGAWLSVQDPTDPNRPINHVLRMPVGGIDLGRLAEADWVAEEVASGRVSPENGLKRLNALDQPVTRWGQWLTVLCCGLASMAVPGLFQGTGYADLLVSLGMGWITGVLAWWGTTHWRVGEAMEALAAFVVTLGCLALNTFVMPLSMNVVVVGGLIALMPGLSLTTALAELSSGQLMTGMARLGGAMTSLMKLTFGAGVALGLGKMLMWQEGDFSSWGALPNEMRMIVVGLGALAFAGLFRAKLKHAWIVGGAVLLGYGVAHYVQTHAHATFGALPVGTFVAAWVVTVVSNVYSTVFHTPGAIIRLPGIIMLVPGSVGFKAGQSLWNNQLNASAEMALLMAGTVVALVAGILLGNLVVSARRKL